MVVIDASATFGALTTGSRHSPWARGVLDIGDLVAPHVLLLEVAQIARKAVHRRELDPERAWKVIHYAKGLIELVPHAPLMHRIWALRDNVSSYDAAYVALAEFLGAPLATLDSRLRQSPGPTCEFLSPE